ncbi:SNF2-related protein [Cohnella panacarvi]|uniref:SNF2-related protein n=1 Tax=Cohnella panacarvi TaxID=400776 RepID=UPI000478E55A|nr:SNF2-related protein [Cohnella panacarvi]
MFKDLLLKATYSSYEDDVGVSFYTPTLRECISYDRATAYFSAKALANYAKGLEVFARRGNKCRMIVSAEISEDDYRQIKEGYRLREEVNQGLLEKLRESLSLEEERSISNLAYLISLGIIDIKIAFTRKGIFHDKFGVMEDEVGDVICFRGSNNETSAAYNTNYESFDITCSWQASTFDYSKITKSKETFGSIWNNKAENILVCDMSLTLYQEIVSHSKGKVIVDTAQLEPNCLLLDYDDGLKLEIKIEPSLLLNNAVYKLRLRQYVDLEQSNEEVIRFKSRLTYPGYKRIIRILEQDAQKRAYRFFTTQRLRDYITSREMYIEKRANVGLSIKNQDPIVQAQFAEYKTVVDCAFYRQLRDKQMWDSFFMCTMKKSGNFSVPGSGKTASVLGVYAYLKTKGLVKRVVIVGPKNAFGSWVDEFKACFDTKQQVQLFSIQDLGYRSTKEKQQAILYDTGNKNLLLFNYESLGTYLTEIKKLIDAETLLVFDEVHKVKALNGRRASDALEVAKDSSYTIALTGTPIPNSYTDIRNLLDILYYDEYADFFGFTIPQLKDPSTDDISFINQKIQPFFCRTTKQELQVPDANPDSLIQVMASSPENELFHILLLKYAKNKLALIIRLLQLESNPQMLLKSLDLSEFSDILDISGDIEQFDYVDFSDDVLSLINNIKTTKKFDACIEVTLQLYREHKPVIIWCIFLDSMMNIKGALEAAGVRTACIYGAISMDERQVILSAFRKGELDVLITNPHTLAESVSLHTVCHDAIYFEYSYNLVHLLQSKDRIHRLGLPNNQYTQYFFTQKIFSTKDGDPYSLDERIYLRLKEKEQIMLDAIENNMLERGSTPEEDLELIFSDLRL